MNFELIKNFELSLALFKSNFSSLFTIDKGDFGTKACNVAMGDFLVTDEGVML